MNKTSKNFTINLKLVNSNNTKAVCELNYPDHVIRGFRVAPSKYKQESSGQYLRVIAPVYGIEGKTRLAFFMQDKELWKHVEGEIINTYLEKIGNTEDEINVENIDF